MVEKLEKEIQTYGEDVRSVTDRLKEYEHRLKDVKKPDLKQFEEECRELERTLEGMNERQTGLVMNIKKNKEIKTAILQMDAHIKSLEDEYELIGHLADIARGQNAYKLTFERYVLASFLDEILVSANNRLTKMTSGRYRLLRKKTNRKATFKAVWNCSYLMNIPDRNAMSKHYRAARVLKRHCHLLWGWLTSFSGMPEVYHSKRCLLMKVSGRLILNR